MRRHSATDVLNVIEARSRMTMSGCVEWTGAITGGRSGGYGHIRLDGKMQTVHRLIFVQSHGPIPKGMQVLHTCDNRRCRRLDHLYLGTNEQNIDDKCRRDRSGKKLCIDKVIELRTLAARGISQDDLATLFGISQGNVSKTIRGIKWPHVQCAGGV